MGAAVNGKRLLTPMFFLFVALLSGCASNMKGYYADLKVKLDANDYEAAASLVDGSKKKYGKKNILLFYLDTGAVNHLARNYSQSSKSFDFAKRLFEDYYQKSISAAAASMVANDKTLPYYGHEYERAHTTVYEALNYILDGNDDEAVVEARQAVEMFKLFHLQDDGENVYKDDGFIRYFMGLVYENAGYLNDAHVSYHNALRAYKEGLSSTEIPQDLINDAYTTALLLNFDERALEIKKQFPLAQKTMIPRGFGECVIIDFNGYSPEKISKIFDFALVDIWPYVGGARVSDDEQEEFARARSIEIALFSRDYVRVAFPEYKDIPNAVASFSASSDKGLHDSYEVQNVSEIAKKTLKNDIGKIYAKTIARAAVKYVLGKSVSRAVEKNSNAGWGILTQMAFNVYSASTSDSDLRSWRTLPENILMARFFLPAGENNIAVNFKDSNGAVLSSQKIGVNIKEGRKNFVVLRSAAK